MENKKNKLTFIKEILKVRDTPEKMARGIAIGFFFGVSLFWGLQIALSVLFAQILKGNKVVAALLTAVSNPLTTIPLYSFCYLIGHLIIPGPDLQGKISEVHNFSEIISLGPQFFITLLVGGTIVGAIGSIILYFSVRRFYKIKPRTS